MNQTVGATEESTEETKKKKTKPKKELERCSVSINAIDSVGNLIDQDNGTKCECPGFTDKYVGEVVLDGPVTQFHCGLPSSNKSPSQAQVAALAKSIGVPLVFDPKVRLDSDDPDYKAGHFRIKGKGF